MDRQIESTVQNPTPTQTPNAQRGRMSKINSGLGVGFVGLEAYSRIKDGESAPLAVGKALATNALWSMVPGGLAGGLAITAGSLAMQAIPAAKQKIKDKKSELHSNLNRFGSNFQSTQAQEELAYQGYNQLEAARNHLATNISGHARNAQQIY